MALTRRQTLASYSQNMKHNMTKAEQRLWFGFLRGYPISFVQQKVIGNYIVDFYCKKAHLSIELDGSQHYTERNLRYDEIRTTYLSLFEIKELRFANSDIWDNFEGVCEEIHRQVQLRRNDISEISIKKLKEKR